MGILWWKDNEWSHPFIESMGPYWKKDEEDAWNSLAMHMKNDEFTPKKEQLNLRGETAKKETKLTKLAEALKNLWQTKMQRRGKKQRET